MNNDNSKLLEEIQEEIKEIIRFYEEQEGEDTNIREELLKMLDRNFPEVKSFNKLKKLKWI